MVDPVTLANDIIQNAAFFLLPPVLLLFLYLFAWQDAELARRTGFGRLTFWLLVPGCLVGSIANLPIFPWNGNVLAVNVGGAAVPVTLALVLLSQGFGARLRLVGVFLAGLAIVATALFVVVWHSSLGPFAIYAEVLVAFVPPIVLLAISGSGHDDDHRTVFRSGVLLALTSFVLVATFEFTSTVTGVGIVSQFPWYFLAPVAAGIFSVAILPFILSTRRESGVAFAYATTTFGVLLGADLLRQPPLYGPGSNIFSIGGAGLSDLVYLSGLLAVLIGYLGVRLFSLRGSRPDRTTTYASGVPSPVGRLRRALLVGLKGNAGECLSEAATASEEAAAQSRRLYGLGAPPSRESPWEGLPVASWVAADQRNLLSLARHGVSDPQDAYRGWLTARWLVRTGRELDRRRLGALGQRVWAFLLDLAVLTVLGVVAMTSVVLSYPGGAEQLAASAPFNAVGFGFASFSLLYFVVAETVYGTTIGKYWFGLSVRTRQLAPPGLTAVLVRDLPKLIPLTVVGFGGLVLVAIFLDGPAALGGTGGGPGGAISAALTSLTVGAFIILGVGLSGAVSALAITASSEKQRLGDFLAGTWVVRSPLRPSGSAAPSVSAATGPFG